MGSVRIDINADGIGDLLASHEVQDMLMAKAGQVADAAKAFGITVGAETGGGEVSLPVSVVDAGTSERARALVTVDHPAALAVEAKHRVLGGSIDAAR